MFNPSSKKITVQTDDINFANYEITMLISVETDPGREMPTKRRDFIFTVTLLAEPRFELSNFYIPPLTGGLEDLQWSLNIPPVTYS